MGIDAVRHVSSDELARFRASRRRGQWGGAQARRLAVPDGVEVHRAEQGPGDIVYVTKPKRVGVKREARDVRDALTDRRLAGILARGTTDPEFVQQLAAVYREKHPELGRRMTDQEIVTVTVEAASKLATERAFKKIGRGVHQ